MSDSPAPKPKLGDILTRLNLVSDDEVAAALEHQGKSGKLFGQSLLDLGYIAEDDLSWALSSQLGLPFVAVSPEMVDPNLVAQFPGDLLRKSLVLPLVTSDTSLSVVLADPTDEATVKRLEYISGSELSVAVGTPRAIRRALNAVLGEEDAESGRVEESTTSSAPASTQASLSSPELVKLLDRAFSHGAAQVHLDPEGSKIRVRFRDPHGTLSEGGHFARESLRDLVDGLRAWLGIGDSPAEGVETWAPGEGCEDLPFTAVRLAGVDGDSLTLVLDGAGSPPRRIAAPFEEEWNRLDELLSRPAGLVVAVAPTRAGREQALARILGRLDASDRRVCVLAPVDLTLPKSMFRVTGTTNAAAARALCRAGGVDAAAGVFDTLDAVEPLMEAGGRDRICVGSLPGNSALGFLARAIEAGISSVLLSEALLAVIALRILPAGDGDDPVQAVSEVLFVDAALRRALQDGGGIVRIREAAREQGFLEISARARRMEAVNTRTREDLERHRYLEDAA